VPADFTSELAAAVADDLLERFSRYVAIDTQSAIGVDTSPSTPGQVVLAQMLADELAELGLDAVQLDRYGYVYATLPGNVEGAPPIGLIAHVDTSTEASGTGVIPLVHRDYDGSVLDLPRGGTRLDPAAMPDLAGKRGHDIVTSSGDTLLGADDKAGVASIMSALRYLIEHPERRRTELRIAFTPDEEIGGQARHLDIEAFGARCAYTVDGSALGEVNDETFSALEALITVTGVNVHPGDATGKMVSALRLVSELVAALPSDTMTPATTSGREGFIHPIEIGGAPDRAYVRVIVRDFEEGKLQSHAALLRETAERIVGADRRAVLDFQLTRQYSNMHQFIARDPEIMAALDEAVTAEGLTPLHEPIRGGTDGSGLSQRGLPTPNIFDGGYDYHSVREWASVQDMAASCATVIRLAEIWSKRAEVTQ
jgi:tripeptide aminopeptidase